MNVTDYLSARVGLGGRYALGTGLALLIQARRTGGETKIRQLDQVQDSRKATGFDLERSAEKASKAVRGTVDGCGAGRSPRRTASRHRRRPPLEPPSGRPGRPHRH
jgi:hypothetical protein